MERRLLPIGTIVLLKESESRVMIAGYMAVAQSRANYVWDYSGFRFPIGYVHDNEVFCFDNEQIDTVVQYGFRNYEWDELMDKMEPSIDELKAKIAENKEEE